jgi:hypothetical protein
MKVFRVHLNDGKDFAVIAERFEVEPSNNKVKFFKSKDEEDKDIHVFLGPVIAVVPAVDLSGDKPRHILYA